MSAAGITDAFAEEVVTGCAVATVHGARLAAEAVTVEHFYDPRLARAFTAAVGCADVDQDDRIGAVARVAQEFPAWVGQLVNARPVMWDTSGSYGRRVVQAAERRGAAFALLDQLEALGLDASAVRVAA